MPDHDYVDPYLASLYDAMNPRESSGDFAFYLPMIMAAESVLDVGCGTGSLLHWARESGHGGRLVGLDPAEGMLIQARRRDDVEWVHGDLSTAVLGRRVRLRGDDRARVPGAAHRRRTADGVLGGPARAEARRPVRLRHAQPAARGWERWTPSNVWETGEVRSWNDAGPFENGYVSFTTTYESPQWDAPQYSESTLRFLDVPALSTFIEEAGLVVDEQYGYWDRTPVTDASPGDHHDRPAPPHLKSRDFALIRIGSASTRSARTLTTPSAFSTTPRISSAGLARATRW